MVADRFVTYAPSYEGDPKIWIARGSIWGAAGATPLCIAFKEWTLGRSKRPKIETDEEDKMEALQLSPQGLYLWIGNSADHIREGFFEGVNHYDHNVYVQRHDLCAKTVPSAALVVETRRNAIDFWLKHFEKLLIIVIPGNHGRTTMKPRFKRYAKMNYETLIGWWLKSLYANEPRVKIVVPESGDYLLPVWGRGLFFTHGDRMGAMSGGGAGMGFAGRTLPIVRGSKNIREQQASIGRRIDYIHIGHWHERLEAAGTFANGTMAGYNEYAHGLRYVAAPAEQWLYFLTEEYGPTARWPIFLSKQPMAERTQDLTEIMAG